MPMQTKRPAAGKAATEPKAKKQQQEDPLLTKCNVVIGAMSTAEGVSEATLKMLEVGVKACLTVPKESRHSVQNSVIQMIREVLESVEVGQVAKVDALRCKIAEADAEKRNREAIAEAASATMQDKSAAYSAADKACHDAREATHAANCAQKNAVSEQHAGDADLLKAGEKKALAEKVLSEDLRPLINGTSADIGQAVKSIAKVGKELGLEAQLIQSAELVLRKTPSERGSFDSMVTQQIDEHFCKSIATLEDQLTNGEVYKEARASKVNDCTKQFDAAVARGQVCQEQLQAARASLEEAETTRLTAKKSVEDFGPEMERTTAGADAADAVLVAHKADISTFTELVEGASVALDAVGEASAEVVQVAASPDAAAV